MVKAASTPAEKYFEALAESYDAIIAAIKAGNERGYRVSNNLLDEAQRGQREALELGKKFAEDPADIGGFYRAVMESATKSQGRALELARQWFDEMSEARGETREAIEKVVKAQRTAGEIAIEVAREAATSTVERVRTGVSRVTSRVAGTSEEAAEEAKEGASRARKPAATAANGSKTE